MITYLKKGGGRGHLIKINLYYIVSNTWIGTGKPHVVHVSHRVSIVFYVKCRVGQFQNEINYTVPFSLGCSLLAQSVL